MSTPWHSSQRSVGALTAHLRSLGWQLWWTPDCLRLTAPDGHQITVSEPTTKRTLAAGYEAAREYAAQEARREAV